MIRTVATVILLAACLQAQAQDTWFTVIGDRADFSVDTVEVNPAPISSSGDNRLMNVRVSRREVRKSWDGVTYRSYQSVVKFNCAQNTAQFQQIRYFMLPAWKGESHTTMTYSDANPRDMRFRDVEPNPTARIIKAACYRKAEPVS